MDKIKAISLYLPQFHQTAENDKWWGEGFTEWTAVKEAHPLFEGHNQPREPLHDNYYNLLEYDTMEWQAQLAKKYKVSGFCFYHYWFKDGKQVLEKPVENLLKWKDIDMPFCFCWANETWARTWDKIQEKNSWAEKFENRSLEPTANSGILLEQRYGNEEDWKQHFFYLLPFFKDERYLKKDGKPIFWIYHPESCHCLNAMSQLWKKLAIENGLPGLYMIATGDSAIPWKEVDASISMPAALSITPKAKRKIENIKWAWDYDDIWEDMLKADFSQKGKVYLGCMTDFDDTPRRGKNGTVFIGSTPYKFGDYFDALVQKSIEMKNEFVFINAWNEWGEGMYLEPDTKNEFRYLENVKAVMDRYENVIIPKEAKEPLLDNLDFRMKQLGKFENYYRLLDRWLSLKEENISLECYLKGAGYHNIAIYGMGFVGKHLMKELDGGLIKICYIVDKNGCLHCCGIPVYDLGGKLPEVDAIIVTVTYDFFEIYEVLKIHTDCPVISLEEIVFES